MIDKLPIALVIFSCTVEKLGRRDYYQIAINNLAQNIDLDLFPYKLLSVKFRPNEKDIAESYKVWGENKGFEVLLHEGNWTDEKSKRNEYIRDYIKVYHNDKLNQFPFVYEQEDDVRVFIKKNNLEYYLNKSAQILVENKDILTCRFTDRKDEHQRINRLNAKYGWTHKKSVKFNDDYTADNDHITYRNYICRTRDMFIATRILYHNFDRLDLSPETSVTNAMLQLTDGETPFICWNPENIYHRHMSDEEHPYEIT